jgi:hypothetical protein
VNFINKSGKAVIKQIKDNEVYKKVDEKVDEKVNEKVDEEVDEKVECV